MQSASFFSWLSKELQKVEKVDLVGKGKIRHSGSIPEDSGSRYKSPDLSD